MEGRENYLKRAENPISAVGATLATLALGLTLSKGLKKKARQRSFGEQQAICGGMYEAAKLIFCIGSFAGWMRRAPDGRPLV
jgi:hypothetical protein